MNKGEAENILRRTASAAKYGTQKHIIRYDNPIFENGEDYGFEQDRISTTLAYINDYQTIGEVVQMMTEGRWKFLYALVRGIADHLKKNYCIYENPNGILMDVTTWNVETTDGLKLNPTIKSENDAEKLQRLKDERIMVELKIKELQEKHKSLKNEMIELLHEFMGGGETHSPM